MTPDPPQQLTEEYAYRNELQMQLDSKESDIEQLREKLNDLQLRVDSSSVTSLQTDETDGNLAGKVPSPPPPLSITRQGRAMERTSSVAKNGAVFQRGVSPT